MVYVDHTFELFTNCTFWESDVFNLNRFRSRETFIMHCILRGSARAILYNSHTRPSVIVSTKSRFVADSFPILYSQCSLLGFGPLLCRFSHSGKGAKRLGTAVRSYLGTLRWFSIPASVGFAYVCYQQFWHIKEREERKLKSGESAEPSQWQVALFKKLPTRACSRAWGKFCDMDLPLWLRKPVIGTFSWYFSCNVAEAIEEEILNYPSVGAFFRRQLKPDARKICDASSIVSPADGRVLHFGVVENDMVEQVKGITYSMKTFLGPAQPPASTLKELESSDDKRLYHCVIYLGPGDYHSFHSPSEWNVKLRRHFPGDLFSVHPGIARMITGLFNHNERVVLSGTWKHGFFSFTAVGAYNVGSINLKFDEDLKTNRAESYTPGSFDELDYVNDKTEEVSLTRGERMGAFNLGSTIVLIFEAPKDFEFHVQPGQKLNYGEAVGSSREDAE